MPVKVTNERKHLTTPSPMENLADIVKQGDKMLGQRQTWMTTDEGQASILLGVGDMHVYNLSIFGM